MKFKLTAVIQEAEEGGGHDLLYLFKAAKMQPLIGYI